MFSRANVVIAAQFVFLERIYWYISVIYIGQKSWLSLFVNRFGDFQLFLINISCKHIFVIYHFVICFIKFLDFLSQ